MSLLNKQRLILGFAHLGTESGHISTRYIRAISFQKAVRFAKNSNFERAMIRAQTIVVVSMLDEVVKVLGGFMHLADRFQTKRMCAKSLRSSLDPMILLDE